MRKPIAEIRCIAVPVIPVADACSKQIGPKCICLTVASFVLPSYMSTLIAVSGWLGSQAHPAIKLQVAVSRYPP